MNMELPQTTELGGASTASVEQVEVIHNYRNFSQFQEFLLKTRDKPLWYQWLLVYQGITLSHDGINVQLARMS